MSTRNAYLAKVLPDLLRMVQKPYLASLLMGRLGLAVHSLDYGPGYRVYFVQRGETLIILLAGGDKRTQEQDIITALDLAQDL